MIPRKFSTSLLQQSPPQNALHVPLLIVGKTSFLTSLLTEQFKVLGFRTETTDGTNVTLHLESQKIEISQTVAKTSKSEINICHCLTLTPFPVVILQPIDRLLFLTYDEACSASLIPGSYVASNGFTASQSERLRQKKQCRVVDVMDFDRLSSLIKASDSVFVGHRAVSDNVDMIFAVFVLALTFDVRFECENSCLLQKILGINTEMSRDEIAVRMQNNLDSVLRGDGHKLARCKIAQSPRFPATALPTSGFFVEIGANSMLSTSLDSDNWSGVTIDAQLQVVSTVSAQKQLTVIHGLVTSDRSKTAMFRSRAVPCLQLQNIILQKRSSAKFCAVIANCKQNLVDILLSLSDFSAVDAWILPNSGVTVQSEQILRKHNLTVAARHKNFVVWKPILFLQK